MFKRMMRELRESRNLTLRGVARCAGVTFSAVWKMETEGFPLPRAATLAAVLQKAYGLVPGSKEHCRIVGAWTAARKLGSASAVPDARQEIVERVLALPKGDVDALNRLLGDEDLWQMVRAMVRAHRITAR
jgi:transcriptional regulator with XRE-family HTH domain